MSGSAGIILRQRVCCTDDCGAVFYICRSCDRGHRYCSERCRQRTRRQQLRQANHKHQQSIEGRLDHRDHQQAYRQRQQQEQVTDQGIGPIRTSVNIPPLWNKPIDEQTDPVRDRFHCAVCGRVGEPIGGIGKEPFGQRGQTREWG